MRSCWVVIALGAGACVQPALDESAEPPSSMAADVAAVIALHGWPCDAVTAVRPSEARWAAVTCRDGRVYEVLVGDDWDWHTQERQTRLQPLLELGKLIEQLTANDAAIRRRAIVALGDLGTGAGPAVPALTRVLTDGAPLVRQAAAEALGKIGSGAAVPALTEALNDPDPAVRKAAAGALAAM